LIDFIHFVSIVQWGFSTSAAPSASSRKEYKSPNKSPPKRSRGGRKGPRRKKREGRRKTTTHPYDGLPLNWLSRRYLATHELVAVRTAATAASRPGSSRPRVTAVRTVAMTPAWKVGLAVFFFFFEKG